METKVRTFEIGDRVRVTLNVMGGDHCGDEHTLAAGAVGRVDTIWGDGAIDVSFPCGTARDGTPGFIINQFDPAEFGTVITREA